MSTRNVSRDMEHIEGLVYAPRAMNDLRNSDEATQDCELVFDDELLHDAETTVQVEQSSAGRAAKTLRSGDIVAGKYRVERVPRRSALGVTAEAVHMQLGERVAIKLLLADPRVYPEAVARFLRGARAAVQIRGEHVARVTDVGTLESGAPYMVTEFLRGSDLDAVLRVREELLVPEGVDYILQAAEALAEAHSLGLVHRNLKPSNLFLSRRPDGTPLVKVLDFCVSEDPFTDGAINMSGTAGHVHSLACLAPEQIREPNDVDARADVWALGAILYQLLTGDPVFSAETTPGLLAKIAADSPVPPAQLRADIPSALEAMILRCLSKDRDARYNSMAELAADLEYFASAEGHASAERISKTRTRGSRSTRPPPLPPSGAPPQRKAIVRVGAAPQPASKSESPIRGPIPQMMLTAVGMSCAAALGAFVAVRSMQSAFGLGAAVAPQNVVATLSPALTAPLAGPVPGALAPVAGAAPSAPVAAAPVTLGATPAAAPVPAPLRQNVPARPRSTHPAPEPPSTTAAGETPRRSPSDDAKPVVAARSKDLFDDTN